MVKARLRQLDTLRPRLWCPSGSEPPVQVLNCYWPNEQPNPTNSPIVSPWTGHPAGADQDLKPSPAQQGSRGTGPKSHRSVEPPARGWGVVFLKEQGLWGEPGFPHGAGAFQVEKVAAAEAIRMVTCSVSSYHQSSF